MMIVMSLFSVVMLATHQLLASGVRYYHESMQELDIQRHALIGLSRMTTELETSNRENMMADSAPVGHIIYPAIFDANRDFETDEDGRTLWKSVGCYFQGTFADGTGVIYNPTEQLPGGAVGSPPDALSFGFDYSHFSTFAGGRVTARNVELFTPELGTDTVKITLVISVSRRGKSTMTLESKALPRN